MRLYKIIVFLILVAFLSGTVSAITQSTSITSLGKTVIKFNGTGSMNLTTPVGGYDWSYLIVGGGGSGGSGYGGGGGGGGVLYCSTFIADAGSEYTITIGAGGAATINSVGTKGSNSSIVNGTVNLQASGGGYGGNQSTAGGAGGSGGGAGGSTNAAVEIAGGANVSGQGYRGGYRTSGLGVDGWTYPSASGGGAGGIGANASGVGYTLPGANGFGSAISGNGYWYGAGGGAASESWIQNGGYTGGGNGGIFSPMYLATDGTDDYGAGGGGMSSSAGYSGAGGDGVVYISYTPVASVWDYDEPGTFYWVCPSYVSKIYIQVVGGGGSGKSGANYISYGLGGKAGGYVSNYGVSVTPGTNYTIVVGSGGGESPVGTNSNNGTVSSFATIYSASGGVGGQLYYPNSGGLGGSGEVGFSNTTKYASNGGSASAYTGGIGGLGYGAGGGGGAYYPYDYAGNGGAGANGTVRFGMMEYSTGNDPEFSVYPTTATIGDVITFTDQSDIRNTLNLTYNWSFGDGEYSDNIGSVTHVYGLYGIYTINLTVISDGGTGYTEKSNHVTIAVSQATTFSTPRTVSFACTDYFGNAIPNLLVTATPLNFTMPSGWFQAYYGLQPGVNISTSVMTGYTGSDGSWAAPMSESVQYRIDFSGAGITPYSETLYPSNTEYYIRIPTSGAYVQPTPASNYIKYTISNVTANATHEYYTVSYQDTSGGTTEVSLTVRNTSGAVLYTGIQSGFGTAETNMVSDAIIHSPGDTATATMSAKQARLGYVNKTYTITWQNLKTLDAFPDWVSQWMGITLLVILAGTFGAISVKFALIIIPVLAWFMTYYMRWIQPQIGISTMVICVSILFTIGALRYMREQKRKLAG